MQIRRLICIRQDVLQGFYGILSGLSKDSLWDSLGFCMDFQRILYGFFGDSLGILMGFFRIC